MRQIIINNEPDNNVYEIHLESHMAVLFKDPAGGLEYLVDVLRTKFAQVGYGRIKLVSHVRFLLT
jgi:hypothetical protein